MKIIPNSMCPFRSDAKNIVNCRTDCALFTSAIYFGNNNCAFINVNNESISGRLERINDEFYYALIGIKDALGCISESLENINEEMGGGE